MTDLKGAPGIEIRVSDTGGGIRPEDLSHVFDPYFTTKPAGTGLGLAIAHNIMETMGGDIAVASRPGAGNDLHAEGAAGASGLRMPA